jgi:hypothetical protein
MYLIQVCSNFSQPKSKFWLHNWHLKNKKAPLYFKAVLRIRIRIHQIHVFLGLQDPDPDPLVRGMDPDPDPSIIMQK